LHFFEFLPGEQQQFFLKAVQKDLA
jgi:hypothetical protein